MRLLRDLARFVRMNPRNLTAAKEMHRRTVSRELGVRNRRVKGRCEIGPMRVAV